MKKHPVLRPVIRVAALVLLFVLFLGTASTGIAKKSKSVPKYKIKINKQCSTVTIYKYSKGKYRPKKAMICSPGGATPIGTFSLGSKMRWHTLMGPSYGQYCSRITGKILFHSVWYYSCGNAAQSYTQYNRLGTWASHGCVRLTVADAKYIYDKIPQGTPIIIYNSKKPGPLGKPKSIKVNGYCGWDPTDPDKNNPYHKKKPVIRGVKKKKTVKFGKKFKPMKGVTATNSTDCDATKQVKVSVYYYSHFVNRYVWVNKVNTKLPGKYRIEYSITDEIGHSAKKTSRVTVNKKEDTSHGRV